MVEEKNLYRDELVEIVNLYEKDFKFGNLENLKKENYQNYLEALKQKLNSVECQSDSRFVTYCRRDFLRQELTKRLNENQLLGALADINDYVRNDTWISLESVPDQANSHKIIDDDFEYKQDRIICKEEKNILLNMIDEFLIKLKEDDYE